MTQQATAGVCNQGNTGINTKKEKNKNKMIKRKAHTQRLVSLLKVSEHANRRLTSSIAVTKVREPPNVAQTHAVSNTGQQELIFPAPLLPWDSASYNRILCGGINPLPLRSCLRWVVTILGDSGFF